MRKFLDEALADLGNALEMLNKEPGAEGLSGYRSEAIAYVRKAILRLTSDEALQLRETPMQRSGHDIHIAQENTLVEILAELRHMRAALGASGSVSSVQLEQDSKGQVKVTVKAYADSDVSTAGTAAVEEFGRVYCEVERRQMEGWRETVEQLQRERAS